MLVDVVMGEVAKTVTASAASAGLTELGRLWRLIRRKADQEPGGLPTDLAAINDFLVQRAREDPEWAGEVARELAARLAAGGAAESLAGVYPPPTPFCDRDTLRADLPERGICVYAGLPGAGKTALVRQLAADRAGMFPVHQCQVDLDLFRDGDIPLLSEAKRHVLRQLRITSIADSMRVFVFAVGWARMLVRVDDGSICAVAARKVIVRALISSRKCEPDARSENTSSRVKR